MTHLSTSCESVIYLLIFIHGYTLQPLIKFIEFASIVPISTRLNNGILLTQKLVNASHLQWLVFGLIKCGNGLIIALRFGTVRSNWQRSVWDAAAESLCGDPEKREYEYLMGPNNSPMTTAATEPNEVAPGPKPGRSLIVNSVLVIGISIVLASLGLRGLMVAEPITFSTSLLIFFLPVAVGILQYAACFRKSLKAAKALFYLHIVGILASIGFGELCLMAAFDCDKERQHEPLIALGVFFLLAILAAVSMWKILRWSDKLAAAKLSDPEDLFRKKRPFQISIYELLLAMTVVALIAGLTSSIACLGD